MYERKDNPNNAGRKGYYQDNHPERAYRLCLLGLKNQELAVAFGVTHSTIDYWVQHKPEFAEAVKSGRAEADSKVAESLYRSALGYEVNDMHICVVKGEVVQTPIIKKFQPNAWACFKWLSLRQREKWTEVQHLHLSGEVKQDKVDLADFTTDELKMMQTLGIKMKPQMNNVEEN